MHYNLNHTYLIHIARFYVAIATCTAFFLKSSYSSHSFVFVFKHLAMQCSRLYLSSRIRMHNFLASYVYGLPTSAELVIYAHSLDSSLRQHLYLHLHPEFTYIFQPI